MKCHAKILDTGCFQLKHGSLCGQMEFVYPEKSQKKPADPFGAPP